MKPGEVTNRGHGITVLSDLTSIQYILQQKEVHKNGNPKTYIMCESVNFGQFRDYFANGY